MFTDRLTLDKPRRTADGYMAVRARAARTGVYQYTGREVDPDNAHGLRDQPSVNVLRDDAAVFDQAAVHSFIGKPITDDHPREAVTSSNWRDHGRGVVMGALRDGDHLAFDLILMDKATIAKVEAGKAELSNGYSAKLEFGDFKGPNGEPCPVRQSSIAGNHVAIVDQGRAGPSCRIGDAATCASAPSTILDSLTIQEKPVKTMLIDGLTVDMANADTAIATATTLRDARDAATGRVKTLETDVATKDARVATLEAEVKALTDAKPTPQQLRDAAKVFAAVVDKAKALGVTVTDAMDETAIRKAVVDAKIGTAATGYTDAMYVAAFDALTVGVKVTDTNVVSIGAPSNILTDAANLREMARRNRNAG